MYEGYSGEEAPLPVRVFAKAGMKQMIVTAACGALNEKYQVGDFCLTSDVLTLFLVLDNPLRGPKFLDMSEVFDPEMRAVARKVMVENGITFHEGVYTYYHGPNFETPADKMALKFLGGDVVGMSTVPETIAARWEKVSVMSLAFVTNLAFVKHDHKDVLAAADHASKQMVTVLEGIIR
jgi:purine-nucleoside phosphorylase